MPRTLEAFQELKETDRLSPYEKELIRPDGTRWWGLFAGTRLGENEAMEFLSDIFYDSLFENVHSCLKTVHFSK